MVASLYVDRSRRDRGLVVFRPRWAADYMALIRATTHLYVWLAQSWAFAHRIEDAFIKKRGISTVAARGAEVAPFFNGCRPDVPIIDTGISALAAWAGIGKGRGKSLFRRHRTLLDINLCPII